MTVGIGDVTYCAALVYAPVQQTTTNSYADVGTPVDTLNYRSISITIKENNTFAVKWKVLASNDSAFTVPVEVQAEAVVIKNATSSYSATVAAWRYYVVQVTANVGGDQGKVIVNYVAKA
jgi:hypothetical protein